MLCSYKVKAIGFYHEKNGIPCQDACNIVKCGDNIIIAAVADGLGSEKYSDIASEIAARVSTDYCSNNICENSNDEHILLLLSHFYV